MNENSIPPKWPLKLLRFFLKPAYLEEVEGDMEEIYQDSIAEFSKRKADRMYAFEMLKLLRPNLLKRLSGSQRLTQYGMINHHFKIGWRSILRDKLHSAINVAGLTIGTTAAIIIMIFVQYESSFDAFHQKAEKTYRVVQHNKFPQGEVFWNSTAYPLAAAMRSDMPELELVTQAAGPFKRMFSVEDETGNVNLFEEDYVLFADTSYPEVFDLEWLSGNEETALDELNSVVLSQRVASRFFGSQQSVIGKTILLNGKEPLIVTGIVKEATGNSNLQYSMIVPYEFFKFHNPYPSGNWSGNYGGTTFVVLPEQVAAPAVEQKLASWKGKYLKPEDDERISYFLQPLKEVHTESKYGSTIGSYQMPKAMLTTAFFIAIFILAIAIVNFVNLVTAKATARAKEVGIRKVVGASRFGLINQFILEKTILVSIALLLSILLSGFLLNVINNTMSVVNLRLALVWADAYFILLIGGITILLATIYPAFVLSAHPPIAALKNEMSRMRGFSVRKLLTVFQFTIVQFFVIAAIIIGIQLNYFNSQELGFSSEAVISVPANDFEKVEVLRNALSENSTVHSVAFGSGPPMAVNGYQLGTTYRLPHQSKQESFQAEMKIGDLSYLSFYDLKLIAGKNFSSSKQGFNEFIVNETLLKSMNWTKEEALGKKLRINEGEATIIGVVQDFHNNSLQREIGPVVFLNWTYFQNNAFIRVSNVSPTSLYEIEKIWSSIFPSEVYSYSFVDDSIEREYALERMVFNGFTIFSVLVVFIGALGLIGLMSFITLRKTKEVGIRKVLGASFSSIVLFFSKEFTWLIIIAFVLATPIAYYLTNQWLQDFEYSIDLSAWMFLAGGLLTFAIAILVSFFQVRKSASVNPVDSLRSD